MLQRNRLAPYKLMVFVLYAESDHLTRCGENKVYLTLSPVARRFHVSASRMKEYIKWLQDANFIHRLDIKEGVACFNVKKPSWLEDDV